MKTDRSMSDPEFAAVYARKRIRHFQTQDGAETKRSNVSFGDRRQILESELAGNRRIRGAGRPVIDDDPLCKLKGGQLLAAAQSEYLLDQLDAASFDLDEEGCDDDDDQYDDLSDSSWSDEEMQARARQEQELEARCFDNYMDELFYGDGDWL